jgi:hypothetical protein
MKPPGFSGSITTSTFSFSRRLRLAWAFLLNFVLYSEILYIVNLTVTDDDGATDSTLKIITVKWRTFYDDFTTSDGPNINETKWRGHINDLTKPEYGRITNNTLLFGDTGISYNERWIASNPTFWTSATNEDVMRFSTDLRMVGSSSGYYCWFGWAGEPNGFKDMYIYFYVDPSNPSRIVPRMACDPLACHWYECIYEGEPIFGEPE